MTVKWKRITFVSIIIWNENAKLQHFPMDYFEVDMDRCICQVAKFAHYDTSTEIYHKFSHDTASVLYA